MDKRELLTLMSRDTQARKYRKGEVIFREGDPPDDGLCLVLAGSVSVSQEIEGQRMTLGVINAGEFLGETALVLKRSRTASAIAAEPGTVILFLTKERVLDSAHHNQAFLITLLKEATVRMEHVLQVHSRQPATISYVIDPTLVPIIDENRHYLMKIPTLLNHTRNMFVAPNKPIFTQGQRNDGVMHLVTDGTINLEHVREDQETVVLYQVRAGDFFGYSRPGTSPQRFFTAIARGESAHVISCDDELLKRVFHLDIEIGWFMLRGMIIKMVILNDSLHAVAAPHLHRLGNAETNRAIRTALSGADDGAAPEPESDELPAPADEPEVV